MSLKKKQKKIWKETFFCKKKHEKKLKKMFHYFWKTKQKIKKMKHWKKNQQKKIFLKKDKKQKHWKHVFFKPKDQKHLISRLKAIKKYVFFFLKKSILKVVLHPSDVLLVLDIMTDIIPIESSSLLF